MRRTKFFCLLLALTLTALLACPAFAADSAAPLRLDANASQSGAGWRWDGGSQTLTLQNASLSASAGTDGSARTVHIACDAEIVLSGKNTIRAGDVTADGAHSWALVVDGACTLTGSGELTLIAGQARGEGGQSVGLLAAGALDFAGTGVIRACAGAADYSCAVSGLADVRFSSGSVSMNGELACAAANDADITLPAQSQVCGAGETVPSVTRRGGRSTFSVSGEPAAQVQVAASGALSGAGLFFEDVAAGDWFCGDVGYALQAGLMSGTSRTQFSPSRATTRGMIVTILYRLAGSPAVTASAPFADVAPDSYCADAAAWAAQTGVAAGIGGGRFAPQRAITRAELAAMLYRFAARQDGGVTNSAAMTAADTAFSDAAQIPAYAAQAAAWAAETGLIRGDAGRFLPQSSAARAQTAAILHRFCELKTDK